MAGSGELARYPRPSVAVDVALFTVTDAGLGVVLVRRDREPLRGTWALPGTILRIDETLDGAAVRVLEQKAGLSGYYLDQLGAFGDLDRDPRGLVISVAYVALARLVTPPGPGSIVATVEGDRPTALTLRMPDGPAVAPAFDHGAMIAAAVARMRGELWHQPLACSLLTGSFTLAQLRTVYEAILGSRVNKDSFRRRILASDLIEPTGERMTAVGHRPPALYRQRAADRSRGDPS